MNVPPAASRVCSRNLAGPPNSSRAWRSAFHRGRPARSKSSARCCMCERSSSSISVSSSDRRNSEAMRKRNESRNFILPPAALPERRRSLSPAGSSWRFLHGGVYGRRWSVRRTWPGGSFLRSPNWFSAGPGGPAGKAPDTTRPARSVARCRRFARCAEGFRSHGAARAKRRAESADRVCREEAVLDRPCGPMFPPSIPKALRRVASAPLSCQGESINLLAVGALGWPAGSLRRFLPLNLGHFRAARHRLLAPLIHMKLKNIRPRIVPHHVQVILPANNLRRIDLSDQNRFPFRVRPRQKIAKGINDATAPARHNRAGILAKY